MISIANFVTRAYRSRPCTGLTRARVSSASDLQQGPVFCPASRLHPHPARAQRAIPSLTVRYGSWACDLLPGSRGGFIGEGHFAQAGADSDTRQKNSRRLFLYAAFVAFTPIVANAQTPTITTQPTDCYTASGGACTLSVGASGTGMTYQWYHGSNGYTTTASTTAGYNTCCHTLS